AGTDRLDPSKLNDMTLMNHWGKAVPLSQVGHIEIRPEEPILKRRDRVPTITIESDIDESLQPPQVSAEIEKAIQPIIASLPEGYNIQTGGNIEESGKANRALSVVFPAMIVLMFTVIIFQVRSFSGMFMVVLTALAAVLAFIPLTFSVFWGSMAYTLIGGTAVGTVLTLVFLPALYSIWFRVKPTAVPSDEAEAVLVRA